MILKQFKYMLETFKLRVDSHKCINIQTDLILTKERVSVVKLLKKIYKITISRSFASYSNFFFYFFVNAN